MGVRRFALIFGIIYLLVGVLGFVPGVTFNFGNNFGPGGGYLAQFFPVNYLHDALHAIIGIWGISVRANALRAVSYARTIALVFLLLGLLGLPDILGSEAIASWLDPILPIGSLDVILHLASAAIAAWFGFGPPARAALTARAA